MRATPPDKKQWALRACPVAGFRDRWARKTGMKMGQEIAVYVINLDRRADRLERMSAHLQSRGVAFIRHSACDATTAPDARIDGVIAEYGPLGRLGRGDRACTVSHTEAWAAFLDSPATHALFLEDDIFLAADLAPCLAQSAWIPPDCHAVKLEKFNEGVSRLLMGAQVGQTPTGRALYPMLSRHVGGGAYILSRKGAEIALSRRGQMRVPVDHFLFNDTVSPVFARLRPAMTVPAMATQRAYAYNSDIAKFGHAVRPTGWRRMIQKLRRGANEINQAPRQIWQWATGRGRIIDVAFVETP